MRLYLVVGHFPQDLALLLRLLEFKTIFMKKILLIALLLLVNIPLSYLVIYSISNIDSFDKTIFIKAIIFSIIITVSVLWAVKQGKSKNNT